MATKVDLWCPFCSIPLGHGGLSETGLQTLMGEYLLHLVQEHWDVLDAAHDGDAERLAQLRREHV